MTRLFADPGHGSRRELSRCAVALSLLLAWGCDQGASTTQAPSAGASPKAVRPREAHQAAAPQVIFLGDSLTAGYGLDRHQAFPALIADKMQAVGLPYRVVNAGRSGDTSAGGLSRLPWYFESSQPVAALVLGLGSNDAMRGLSLQAMEENLRQIIQETHKRYPQAKVFLWQLETFPNLGAKYVQQYAAVFPRVAKQTGATLIPFPLRGVAGDPSLNQADGIHPNAKGTVVVADNIWRVLSDEL